MPSWTAVELSLCENYHRPNLKTAVENCCTAAMEVRIAHGGAQQNSASKKGARESAAPPHFLFLPRLAGPPLRGSRAGRSWAAFPLPGGLCMWSPSDAHEVQLLLRVGDVMWGLGSGGCGVGVAEPFPASETGYGERQSGSAGPASEQKVGRSLWGVLGRGREEAYRGVYTCVRSRRRARLFYLNGGLHHKDVVLCSGVRDRYVFS